MVVRPDGTKYEPSVWDIDDSEPTPKEVIGNWMCMLVAVSAIAIISPLLFISFGLLAWKGDAETLSQATESSLPALQRRKARERELQKL